MWYAVVKVYMQMCVHTCRGPTWMLDVFLKHTMLRQGFTDEPTFAHQLV